MLLDRSGEVISDPWEGREITASADLRDVTPERRDLAVKLDAGADLEPILPFLGRLKLVVVPFPGFRDGRGFTAARALRERHGFKGEIRASGHLLADQFVALLRVGVSTVELPDSADLAPWIEALRLSGEYDPTNQALPWIRRAVLPFETA